MISLIKRGFLSLSLPDGEDVMLGETFSAVLFKMHRLLFCHCSVKLPFGLQENCFVLVCRYLFALQIKQDISSGRLTCNDTSAALMVSHIIQCKYLKAVFSFGSREHRVLPGKITVYLTRNSSSNIVMKHFPFPHLLIISVLHMIHHLALLLPNKYSLCPGEHCTATKSPIETSRG